ARRHPARLGDGRAGDPGRRARRARPHGGALRVRRVHRDGARDARRRRGSDRGDAHGHQRAGRQRDGVRNRLGMRRRRGRAADALVSRVPDRGRAVRADGVRRRRARRVRQHPGRARRRAARRTARSLRRVLSRARAEDGARVRRVPRDRAAASARAAGTAVRAHLLALGAIVAACIAAAAGVHDAVLLDLLFTLLLYAVLGQSWNWISGYAGNVSFGHAIFFACGAYAAALCVTHGLSPWLAFPAGALAAAALAAITGFPTLALRGHYFSIATIAVAALVDAFVRNVPGLGGANGFELPIASGWAALQFPAKGPYVLLALVLFAAAQLATILLERSR